MSRPWEIGVEVKDEEIGSAEQDGTITFTIPEDADELEIEVKKGKLKGELEIELQEGEVKMEVQEELKGEQARPERSSRDDMGIGKGLERIASRLLPDSWPNLKRMRHLMFEKNRIFEEEEPGALDAMIRINGKLDELMVKAVEDLRRPPLFWQCTAEHFEML